MKKNIFHIVLSVLCLNLLFYRANAGPNTCTDYGWAIQSINNNTGLHGINVVSSYSDLNGNIILTGNYSGTFDFQDNDQILFNMPGISFTNDMFVASISPSGNVNWLNTTLTSGYHTQTLPSDVVTDDNGNIYVTGRYTNKSTVQSPMVFQGTNSSSASIPYTLSNTNFETFIIKYTAAGVVSWVTNPISVGSVPSAMGAEGVAIDVKNGNLIAMHHFYGTVNISGTNFTNSTLQHNTIITKVNPSNGSYTWAKAITTTNNTDFAEAAEIKIGDSEFYISGVYRGSISFSGTNYSNTTNCSYISKLKLNGNVEWFKTIEDGWVTSIELSQTCKNLYATGLFSKISGLTIDGNTVPAIGQSQGHNIFVTSIAKNGIAEWVSPIHGFLALSYYSSSADNLELDEDDNLYIHGQATDIGVPAIDDVFSGDVKLNTNFAINTQFSFTFKFLKNGIPVNVNDHNNIETTTYDRVTDKFYIAGNYYNALQFGTTNLTGGAHNIYLAQSQQRLHNSISSHCLQTCPKQPVQLSSFIKYGSALTYKWTPNTFLDADHIPVVNFDSPVVGIHDNIIRVEDANGCHDIAHIEVVVLDDTPPVITLANNEVCVNSPLLYPSVPDPDSGTWDASCVDCIDPVTGAFDPVVAGVGVHEIYFDTPCARGTKEVKISPDYVCCLEENITEEALILKGYYTLISLNVPDGSTVIIEDDVVFDNMTLNWNDVTIYVEGRNQGMNVTGSTIELVKTNATFKNCTFQSTCDNMWKGIEISNYSYLNMTHSKILDAYKGLEILDNTIDEIKIQNSEFFHNYYSMYFKTGEFEFPIEISETKFNSSKKKMKVPYKLINSNNFYYSEAHLYFEHGISKLFPFTFTGNTLEKCKYGIYSTDNNDMGMLILSSSFNKCFASGVYARRLNTGWQSGNGPTNDLILNECHFNYGNVIPSTPQFSGISQSYGIVQSAGDLEAINCNFYGSKNNFTADIGIRFYNPVYKLRVHNSTFNHLGSGIQIRAFGGKWLKLNQGGQTQVENGGTEIMITSNFFTDNDESIKFMSNNAAQNAVVPGVVLPPIPSGATNISGCPNCPVTDIFGEVSQTISCNEFVRTDGLASYAIYVEPNTLMQHIGTGTPAGNEIIDPTNNMRSIWNLGSIFKYRHYANEIFGPSTSNYPFFNATFINSNTFATDNTCPGTAGVRKATKLSLSTEKNTEHATLIYPNPSSTGVFNFETTEFDSDAVLSITTISGQVIIRRTLNQDITQIDLSEYSKGLYFVTVTDENHQISKKIIIE